MNPLNNPRVKVLELEPDFYTIRVDEQPAYTMCRSDERPYYWQLHDVKTATVVDTGQYRYDMFERVALKYGEPKHKPGDVLSLKMNVAATVVDIQFDAYHRPYYVVRINENNFNIYEWEIEKTS